MILSKKALLFSFISVLSALNPIVIKGSKFFDSVTGDQFFIKGVAYQPRGDGKTDPLSSPNCVRDVKLLQELGVNTIRVYETYPFNNHDECMKALEKAGIYLVLDLAVPSISVNREQPHYDTSIFSHYKQKMDAFTKYNNILAFLAGNEVTNDEKTTPASAHIKAALRDMKAYVKTKSRVIPVGYADNDDPLIRANVQSFFNCGSDDERADFYGINIYSWCGESSFKNSGYDKRTKELEDYGIPVMLSEFGCNAVKPRAFGDMKSLYNSDMDKVFSGGIVYEFTEEENNYGLVKIDGDKVKKLPDFETVKKRFEEAKPTKANLKSYKPNTKKRNCPKVSKAWQASDKLPPTPSEDACACLFDTLDCRVSTQGDLKENGEAVGKLVGNACGDGLCDDIIIDTAKGEYGQFSACNSTVRNSIVFSAAVKKGAKCDFKGFAAKVKSSSSDSGKCAKLPANLKSSVAATKPTGYTNGGTKRSTTGDDDDDESDSASGSKSKSSSNPKSNSGSGDDSGAGLLTVTTTTPILLTLAAYLF